jgi:tyrosinase
MGLNQLDRRDFIKAGIAGTAVAALPVRQAYAQTVRTRPAWEQFRTTTNYAQYVNAIRTMRANTNANDRGSWNFWVNAHMNNCPHSIPYFLAWHRGFVYYFEQQLRIITGNSAFMLPYWDYYRNPVMPVEFTNPAGNNPLYVDRVNTNVSSALSLAPFSLTNFQRGTTNAFETSLEPRPHGQVHNIIGGAMASLRSPTDPIFWLHHGEIDRLVHAWVMSGGKRYPPSGDPYWDGTLTFSSNLTLARRTVYNPATLGYTYQDNTLPRSLPVQTMQTAQQTASAPIIMRASMDSGTDSPASPSPDRGAPGRPPVQRLPLTEARTTGENRRSIGGVREILLGATSISAQIPVEASDGQALKALSDSTQAPPFGRSRSEGQRYRSVQIVLDDVHLTPAGELGGYYYEVYLNLPPNVPAGGIPPFIRERCLVSSFGPFEVSSALHHGGPARLVFPATQLLQNFTDRQIKELTVSFVRVSGGSAPAGPAIVVGEMRIELSDDEIE